MFEIVTFKTRVGKFAWLLRMKIILPVQTTVITEPQGTSVLIAG